LLDVGCFVRPLESGRWLAPAMKRRRQKSAVALGLSSWFPLLMEEKASSCFDTEINGKENLCRSTGVQWFLIKQFLLPLKNKK
jgi:hypothetical protein